MAAWRRRLPYGTPTWPRRLTPRRASPRPARRSSRQNTSFPRNSSFPRSWTLPLPRCRRASALLPQGKRPDRARRLLTANRHQSPKRKRGILPKSAREADSLAARSGFHGRELKANKPPSLPGSPLYLVFLGVLFALQRLRTWTTIENAILLEIVEVSVLGMLGSSASSTTGRIDAIFDLCIPKRLAAADSLHAHDDRHGRGGHGRCGLGRLGGWTEQVDAETLYRSRSFADCHAFGLR